MIEIRELRDGDLESVRGLLAQLAAHASTAGGSVASIDIESIYRELRETPSVYQNWIAVEGERVIGFLSLMLYKTFFHAGGTAQINELVVERDRRGEGVGRLLIERAVAEARRRGMDEIEVGTERGNAAAQLFYRRNGFDEEYVLLGMGFPRCRCAGHAGRARRPARKTVPPCRGERGRPRGKAARDGQGREGGLHPRGARRQGKKRGGRSRDAPRHRGVGRHARTLIRGGSTFPSTFSSSLFSRASSRIA